MSCHSPWMRALAAAKLYAGSVCDTQRRCSLWRYMIAVPFPLTRKVLYGTLYAKVILYRLTFFPIVFKMSLDLGNNCLLKWLSCTRPSIDRLWRRQYSADLRSMLQLPACGFISGEARLAVRCDGVGPHVSVDVHRRVFGRNLRHHHPGADALRHARSAQDGPLNDHDQSTTLQTPDDLSVALCRWRRRRRRWWYASIVLQLQTITEWRGCMPSVT